MSAFVSRVPRVFATCKSRPFSSLRVASPTRPSTLLPRSSFFHSTSVFSSRKRHDYFSSKAPGQQSLDSKPEEVVQSPKRKTTRSPAAKNSLIRVAVEAQRSRDGKESRKTHVSGHQTVSKTVTAICAAEEYDVSHVARILRDFGHELDPYKTDLYPQVVHVSLPVQTDPIGHEEGTLSTGDLFIFPSGTAVAWGIPESMLSRLVSKTLLPAARYPLSHFEEEDLEYIEDPKKENSSIRGDRIILGTRPQASQATGDDPLEVTTTLDKEGGHVNSRKLDTVLAKIAFSSGLARSTKLAVLESLLSDYFESTRSIPVQLSKGGRLPFTRNFISQKTGQLLSIRAQLNLYSELTDSLPDLFWDSRHELGLEAYYDQVGRALDISVRIKVLNEKMDYAQEIASVLRQHLSELHGVRLEWIIILLIAVEVVFAILKEWKDYRERNAVGHEDQKQVR